MNSRKEHVPNEFKPPRYGTAKRPPHRSQPARIPSSRKRGVKPTCFYAVRVGRQTGIFHNWELVKPMVQGYPGAEYKKFETAHGAAQFLNEVVQTSTQSTIPTVQSNSRGAGGLASDRSKQTRAAVQAPISHRKSGVCGGDEPVVVYTDGACSANGTPRALAGVGVYWGDGDERNVSILLPGKPHTNQRAELAAILMALQIYDRDVGMQEEGPLHVFTDSEYSVRSLVGSLQKRISGNWTTQNGQPVANQDILWPTVQLMQGYPDTIIQHVFGHTGVPGNEAADRLARAAVDAELLRRSIVEQAR